MRALLRDIDQLLRGGFTREGDLAAGRIRVPVRTLVTAGLLLGVIYGVFMGLYAVLRPSTSSFAQMAATAVKVPLLFLLTLAVTFPSLYVFSALCRSRLSAAETLRLLLASIAVHLALLASFGPVTGFFTLSTDSYPFMVLLNVLFMTLSGLVGLGFLRRSLGSVFAAGPSPDAGSTDDPEVVAGEGTREDAEGPTDLGDADDEAHAADPARSGGPTKETRRPAAPSVIHTYVRRPELADHSRPRRIFAVWAVTYGIVGAQMGWILRPFIGSPDLPFTFLRARDSNFFEAVMTAWGRLLTGG